MSAPVFIGDEVTAAGYRLAGAKTIVPAAADTAKSFAAALGEAPLVLITAARAAELPRGEIARAMRRAEPPVLVVPGAAGEALPDLAADIGRALGIEK
jgi:vacuolar-type H+-ATPase subunit F/Vma7